MDIRVPIMGSDVPFALKRYKAHNDMFDVTIGAELFATRDVLHDDEIAKIRTFCREMGLDYGELDVLRDNRDGRIYIVDVNNTPAGPIGPLYKDKGSLFRWYELLATSLVVEFHPKTN
jgi:glutathione synthase/RimK-type ligase-like ATP-grasp enzyme